MTIHVGDCRESMAAMPERSVQCVVTSPPYWGLRDYGIGGQLGLEQTPDEYLAAMVEVFRAVKRVLRDDGVAFVNMGDGYNNIGGPGKQNGGPIGPTAATAIEGTKGRRIAGLKPKDLIGMPWRLAFALQADGWYLRSDIIWAKPNPMPESVTDRPTKSHEHVFLLTKRARYFYDADAVREASPANGRTMKTPDGWDTQCGAHGTMHRSGRSAGAADTDIIAGRNLRDVWNIPTEAYAEAHFATFPRRLVEPCIKAGTSDKGCCPECGAPWRRVVSKDRQPTRPGVANVNDPTGMANRDNGRHVTASTTTGWAAQCFHGTGESDFDGVEHCHPDPHDPIPCVVLDPFAGSGTTGVVAKQLGRAFVGCELNPEYVEMARKRIENPEPLPPVVDVQGQEMLDFA